MKSSCIDLIWTNKAQSFQTTYVIETGLSDFHRMTTTTSALKCILERLIQKLLAKGIKKN